jgi:hypothetical protein
MVAEVSVHELYGDFRQTSRPAGTMEMRFVFYQLKDGDPGRVVMDQVCMRETPLSRKTPDALMTAWNADLREIMQEIESEYVKANQHK